MTTADGADGADPTRVRLVSWNVRSLRDDVEAVVAVLRALAPDVVCLQEAPRFFRWRHAIAELARRSGLFFTCGGATTSGTALLSALRVDVDSVAEHALSRTPRLHRRGLAVARFRVAGAPLSVASMHLGLDAAERVRHAHEILALLLGDPRCDEPVVLAGDLNELPGAAAWQALATGGLRDGFVEKPDGAEPTFPAGAPRSRIDAVLLGRGVDAAGVGVPSRLDDDLLARATDHRPVVAEILVRRGSR